MKVSDNEAHVCMENSKIGEKVTLYKNTCTGARGVKSCEKVQLGYGTVTDVLNSHYSVVKFDSGVPFEEGTFVEKR